MRVQLIANWHDFWGQSNEEQGASNTADLAGQTQILRPLLPKIFFHSTDALVNNGQWQNLHPGVNTNFNPAYVNTIGPETGFALMLHKFRMKNDYIMKFAVSGAPLKKFNANPAFEKSAGELFKKWEYFTMTGAEKLHRAGIKRIVLRSHASAHTEADSTDYGAATGYYDNYKQLWEHKKLVYARCKIDVSQVVHIITRLPNNFTPGTRPYLQEANQCLEDLAFGSVPRNRPALPNCKIIATDDLAKAADLTHFLTGAELQLGHRRAQVYLGISPGLLQSQRLYN